MPKPKRKRSIVEGAVVHPPVAHPHRMGRPAEVIDPRLLDWLLDRVTFASERARYGDWNQGYEAATRDILRAVRMGEYLLRMEYDHVVASEQPGTDKTDERVHDEPPVPPV